MAILYCKSGGSVTSPFDTWAKAHDDLEVLLSHAAATAGSTIYVDSTYSHTKTGADLVLWTNGTAVAPLTVITVDASQSEGSEVYQQSSAATLATSGAIDMWIEDQVNYIGVTFQASRHLYWDVNSQCEFFNCKFRLVGGSNNTFRADQGDLNHRFENCTWQVSHASSGWQFGSGAHMRFFNLSVESGGTAPTNLVKNLEVNGGYLEFNCCDFSGMASSGILLSSNAVPDPSDGTSAYYRFNKCKLPTSGDFFTTAPTSRGFRFEAYSVDSGDTIHNFHVEDQYGTITDNTSTYRTSGATYDGSTNYSVAMTPKARTKKWVEPLRFKLCDMWVAANQTLTVEVAYDNATARQDNEAWLEIEYPDATNGALTKLVNTKPSTILTTASNLTASTEGWTGASGFTTSKISHTVSGGQAGIHRVWVCYAPEATTPVLFVDPKVDVS